jgi:hypothetical protein
VRIQICGIISFRETPKTLFSKAGNISGSEGFGLDGFDRFPYSPLASEKSWIEAGIIMRKELLGNFKRKRNSKMIENGGNVFF